MKFNRAVYDLSITQLCYTMKTNGIKVDKNYCREAIEYEQAQLSEATKDFETDTGRTFKDSFKLFAEIFTERGERFPRTEKGNPSFKADFLERINTPLAQSINKIRHHEKRISTYYKNYLRMAGENDLLHPRIADDTTTGRFRYANPNLQNVPKADKGKYKIRNAFKAQETFFELDYKAVEYRVLADYANEKYLIRAINNGTDVHQATADLLGITRKQAKTVNFGILYGCGVNTLAEMLGTTTEEASFIRKEYFHKLPNIAKFIDQVRTKCGSRGYVQNWIGSRCYIQQRKDSYKLVNYLIQSSAADVIKMALIAMKSFHGIVKVQVHDSLLLDTSDEDKVQEIKKIMEASYRPRNGIRLEVDIEKGLSWGELKAL